MTLYYVKCLKILACPDYAIGFSPNSIPLFLIKKMSKQEEVIILG